jgi:hypothetical protein
LDGHCEWSLIVGLFPYIGSGTLTATIGADGDTVTSITGSFITNTTGSPTTIMITRLGSASGADDLIFPIGTQFTSGTTYTSVGNLDTHGLDFNTTAGTILIYSTVVPNASASEATGNFYSAVGGGFGVGLFNLTPTPLPAALPLFAGGLGMLGLFGRRRKQKALNALAA